ncbi:hypothetical protein IGI04_029849 [Brassica rapa subsp. trilocularis]|uniref:Uncharacterized protein n=1 Tax=Brassica rapa subsp. trilocularis TaxID=1813537 RepID=A0ABQ7LP01_BRACM|nr:hypothetical protein IGI04_029849 [Brassica rapa subsp. trilocularis]
MEDFDLGGKPKLFHNLGVNSKFYLNLGGCVGRLLFKFYMNLIHEKTFYGRLMEHLWKTPEKLKKDFDLGGKPKLFQNLGENHKFYLNSEIRERFHSFRVRNITFLLQSFEKKKENV